MQLQQLVSEDVTLDELEDLQRQLHKLLVQKFGAGAAAAVLGRALACSPSAQEQDSTAPAAAAAAAAAADGARQDVAAPAAAAPAPAPAAAPAAAVPADLGLPPPGHLNHTLSSVSDMSDLSDASDGSAHVRWQRAVGLALHNTDPWASRRLHKLPMEVVTRYRYTAATRTWVKDDVLVKMERRPFAAGAMRECFALKKLSTFSSSVYRDWKKAPNFVAKLYKKPVDRTVYFADVVLQMDAKFLGDEYNNTSPPKKVDVMQAAVIEFKDRPNKPLFCVEHLIEGDYVKYNSNSGYVATQPLTSAAAGAASKPESSTNNSAASAAAAAAAAPADQLDRSNSGSDNNSPKKQQQAKKVSFGPPPSRQGSSLSQDVAIRHTPQAFSHFTYSFSMGAALCVDIQGVGDLYTDPQIHTLDGQGYGDGNLGLRGMALFFRTHECNLLCSRLKLAPFERCATDVAAQGYTSSSSTCSGTMFRSSGSTVTRRYSSILGRLEQQRQMEQQPGPSRSLEDLLAQLEDVPLQPLPDALLHWEVARIYAETVTLPELRPDEDPDAARLGGMFHLTAAAAKGLTLAQLELACGHLGLEPNSTQLAHLLKEARAAGEFKQHPQLALRYTQLAAERGIRGAAAALSYAYATGEGVAAGCVPGPLPAAAVSWLRKLLPGSSDCPGELFATAPDGLNPRTASTAAAAASTSGGGPVTPRTPAGSSITPAAATPRNSIARLISGRGARGGSISPAAGAAAALASPAGGLLGPDGVPVGSLFALADHLSQAATAALTTARSAFNTAAEEEAKLLPGASRETYELWADLGELLLKGGPGVSPTTPASGSLAAALDAAADTDAASAPAAAAAARSAADEEEALLLPLRADPAAAAEAFNAAAEEASAAFKGKLAQRYFERAAEAEAAAEEQGEAEE